MKEKKKEEEDSMSFAVDTRIKQVSRKQKNMQSNSKTVDRTDRQSDRLTVDNK